MKSAFLGLIALVISTNTLGMTLSFNDHVVVDKTYITADLPVEYIKLHRDFSYKEEKRMIAGNFESKKIAKKSYADGLRSKLQGLRPGYRF